MSRNNGFYLKVDAMKISDDPWLAKPSALLPVVLSESVRIHFSPVQGLKPLSRSSRLLMTISE